MIKILWLIIFFICIGEPTILPLGIIIGALITFFSYTYIEEKDLDRYNKKIFLAMRRDYIEILEKSIKVNFSSLFHEYLMNNKENWEKLRSFYISNAMHIAKERYVLGFNFKVGRVFDQFIRYDADDIFNNCWNDLLPKYYTEIEKEIHNQLKNKIKMQISENKYNIRYKNNVLYIIDKNENVVYVEDNIQSILIKDLNVAIKKQKVIGIIRAFCSDIIKNEKREEQKIKREEHEKEKRKKEEKLKRQMIQKETQIITSIIEQYFSVLYTKYRNTHYIDDYGNIIVKGWEEEIEYFINNVVLRENKFSYFDLHIVSFKNYYNKEKEWYDYDKEKTFRAWKKEYTKPINTIDKMFNQVLEKKQNKGNVELEQSAIKTGIDYENYIETLLKNKGFVVKRTPKSGDQGVDLIVEGNNNRIAIQCKFYSKPVGNKAVQEVSAGKDYYNCALGCVVSNNSFTPSARKLANSLEITLLNNDAIIDYVSVNS